MSNELRFQTDLEELRALWGELIDATRAFNDALSHLSSAYPAWIEDISDPAEGRARAAEVLMSIGLQGTEEDRPAVPRLCGVMMVSDAVADAAISVNLARRQLAAKLAAMTEYRHGGLRADRMGLKLIQAAWINRHILPRQIVVLDQAPESISFTVTSSRVRRTYRRDRAQVERMLRAYWQAHPPRTEGDRIQEEQDYRLLGSLPDDFPMAEVRTSAPDMRANLGHPENRQIHTQIPILVRAQPHEPLPFIRAPVRNPPPRKPRSDRRIADEPLFPRIRVYGYRRPLQEKEGVAPEALPAEVIDRMQLEARGQMRIPGAE